RRAVRDTIVSVVAHAVTSRPDPRGQGPSSRALEAGSLSGAFPGGKEADPEVRVNAFLARPRLEERVAQIGRPFREQPCSLAGDAALRARGALDGADDARDVHPDVLLSGHVEAGDSDALEVLPERLPLHLQDAAEHPEVRCARRPGWLLAPPPRPRRFLLRWRSAADGNEEDVVANGRLGSVAEAEPGGAVELRAIDGGTRAHRAVQRGTHRLRIGELCGDHERGTIERTHLLAQHGLDQRGGVEIDADAQVPRER